MITPFSKTEQLKNAKAYKKTKSNLEEDCRELWRYLIYLRANYKCEYPKCNFRWNKLDAHHYFSKGAYPHLRFDLQNGICLCAKHHTAGFSRESAHSDPSFKDKILGRVKGYKAIRTEEWAKILEIRACQTSHKLDFNLEKLYLINELKKYKEEIKMFSEQIGEKFIKKYDL